MRIQELERMASKMIGDGKSPDLFFVTQKGDVQLIAQDFRVAYRYWKSLPRNCESSLESRGFGCIGSNEPDEETGLLVFHDDSEMFLNDD